MGKTGVAGPDRKSRSGWGDGGRAWMKVDVEEIEKLDGSKRSLEKAID